MSQQSRSLSIRSVIVCTLILINIAVLYVACTYNESWYWWLLVGIPLLIVALIDSQQKKHAIIRNYPVIGHLRYFFEWVRPELRQYFFESDLDGKPFNRRQRSIVYQRAKNEKQTVAFGMQEDPVTRGYEWVAQSI
jgi:hypothetical protein